MGIAISRFDAIVPAGRVRAKTPDVSDFVYPSSVNPSSSHTEIINVLGVTAAEGYLLHAGDKIRAGEKFTNVALRLKYLISADFYLSKSGSPTGPVTCTLRKTSDDLVIATATTTFDASTLTNSAVLTPFLFADGTQLPNEDFYILVEFSGGSPSHRVRVDGELGNPYSGGVSVSYITSYTTLATHDHIANIKISDGATVNLADSDTSTFHKTNNETNPYYVIDFGAVSFIAGLRIFWNTTGRPSRYMLQVSDADDGVTFDDTIVTFGASPDANAFTNYIFGVRQKRYLRIIADGTLAMEIAEILVYTQTNDQLTALHGHGEY